MNLISIRVISNETSFLHVADLDRCAGMVVGMFVIEVRARANNWHNIH